MVEAAISDHNQWAEMQCELKGFHLPGVSVEGARVDINVYVNKPLFVRFSTAIHYHCGRVLSLKTLSQSLG
jgi:hypothetical protein